MTIIIYTLIAYLFGSISSAIIISKLFGLTDPRQVGSGNPGATNVLRSGNKTAAALTLLGDMLKGLIPVLLAKYFTNDPVIIAFVAMAAFFGHLFPVFFGFKGGKGVATALGVYLALHPLLFAGFIISWMLIAYFFRYSSLAALTASALSILFAIILFTDLPIIGAIFVIVGALFYRHRENIERLQSGTESKIGDKKK